jgi:hypothetical protein
MNSPTFGTIKKNGMKTLIATIAATVIVLTSFGQGFKLAVSEDLKKAHDEYKVKGRQGILIKQKLSFGDYSSSVVKRSWTKGGSSYFGLGAGTPGTNDHTNIISMEYQNRKQTVFFNLTNGKEARSEVFAASNFRSKDLEIGNPNNIVNIAMDLLGVGGRSQSTYYVQIYTDTSAQPWQMLIDNQAAQAQPNKYIGLLAKDKDNYYTIVPVTKIEKKNGKVMNTLAGTIGFEFKNSKGVTAAAVSLVDNGMVFIGHLEEQDRFLLANACAALLLQQEIDE